MIQQFYFWAYAQKNWKQGSDIYTLMFRAVTTQ